MSKLSIAVATAERVPLAKVGGLADVTAALTDTLAARGHTVRCLMPAYETIELPSDARRERILDRFPVPLGERSEMASVDRIELADSQVEVYLIDHEGEAAYFRRPGIYDDPGTGREYADSAERFLFFDRALCEFLERDGRPVDVLHLNDNQTAFLAPLIRRHYAGKGVFSRTAVVLALHNVGYQGIYPAETIELAQIPRHECSPGSAFEFYGKLNLLKSGIAFSDLLVTVSERYAEEIRTGPQFGFGLEGVLQERAQDLRGILNGIDYKVWDPQSDPLIPERYSATDLAGKQACKNWLVREAGWSTEGDWPVVGMIARLVDQKGFDLIEEAVPELVKLEARFFILGNGLKKYEDLVTRLSRAHPDRFHARPGFDDKLAHRIEAGADLFLMPSLYEPCGLNQMISMRYGTVPVVRATGGLSDTVKDFDPDSREGSGFVFVPYESGAMVGALKRALASYRQPRVWNALMLHDMKRDFSWDAAADGYEKAYRDALERAKNRTDSVGTGRVRERL